jgi:hypothetical protein
LQACTRGRYPSELACPWQCEDPDRERIRESTRGAYDPEYVAREGALRSAEIWTTLAALVLGSLEHKLEFLVERYGAALPRRTADLLSSIVIGL